MGLVGVGLGSRLGVVTSEIVLGSGLASRAHLEFGFVLGSGSGVGFGLGLGSG